MNEQIRRLRVAGAGSGDIELAVVVHEPTGGPAAGAAGAAAAGAAGTDDRTDAAADAGADDDRGPTGTAAARDGGDGAGTVVLVHGYPDTGEMWADVVDRLVARGRRVVVHDVRGAGASSAPASRDGYRIELLADDIEAVVAATSPGRPVHLVGHDWGSVQSWEAVTRPGAAERIASFTSISGPCLDHVGHWMRERRTFDPGDLGMLARQGAHSWYVAAFHLPGVPALWQRGGARIVQRQLVRSGQVPEGTSFPSTFVDDGARGIELYRANVARRLRSPGERTTDVPVQLIVPRHDRYVLPALTEGVEHWAPRLRRREVDAGHWVTRTHPDEVAGWIAEHIDDVEAPAAPASDARA